MGSNILLKFKNRKVDYSRIMETFFMSNGVACICLNVNGIDDIISGFSVPGYEMLNGSVIGYIDKAMEHIPVEVPVAIEFCGHHFTEDEQKVISNAVLNYYELELGKALKDRRANMLRLIWFVLFFVIASALIISKRVAASSKEIIYVLFYFLGDRMIDYFVFGSRDTEHSRLRYAQLVSMKVIFRDVFLDRDFTDEEAAQIKSDVAEYSRNREI